MQNDYDDDDYSGPAMGGRVNDTDTDDDDDQPPTMRHLMQNHLSVPKNKFRMKIVDY